MLRLSYKALESPNFSCHFEALVRLNYQPDHRLPEVLTRAWKVLSPGYIPTWVTETRRGLGAGPEWIVLILPTFLILLFFCYFSIFSIFIFYQF